MVHTDPEKYNVYIIKHTNVPHYLRHMPFCEFGSLASICVFYKGKSAKGNNYCDFLYAGKEGPSEKGVLLKERICF